MNVKNMSKTFQVILLINFRKNILSTVNNYNIHLTLLPLDIPIDKCKFN